MIDDLIAVAECRRFAPQLDGWLPVVSQISDWCGEYQPQSPQASRPSDEQMVLGIVKGVAVELTAAADALDAAAAQIKNEGGKGYRASLAKQAAQRARAAAQELVGE